MRLIEFFQPIAVPKACRVSIPLYYLGGSYQEYQNYLSNRLFERMVVNEAAIDRYRPMIQIFKTIDDIGERVGIPPAFYAPANEELQWAMRILKRDDRIVWYLRLYKLSALQVARYNIAGHPDDQADYAKVITTEYTKASNKINRHYNNNLNGATDRFHTIRTEAQHFLALDIAGIQNTVWDKQTPAELIHQFKAIERAWAENRKAVVDVHDDETITPLITFSDGSVWFDLHRPSCAIEGRAMGHCGNAGGNDAETVLSYREPVDAGGRKVVVKNGNYTGTTWKPRLTFIFNTDTGTLGEMKGRANKKPKAELHPKIVALLKLDIIKGIVGGGYDPANNFALLDLPDNVREPLLVSKPELRSYYDIYMHDGLSPMLVDKINTAFRGVPFERLDDNGETVKIVITDLSSPYSFIDTYAGDTDLVRWAADIVFGDYGYEDASTTFSLSDSSDFMSKVISADPRVKTALTYYMATTYDEDFGYHIDKTAEQQYYDINDISDIISVLSDGDDDLLASITQAQIVGEEVGTESEIETAMEKWLSDPLFNFYVTAGWNTNSMWDTDGMLYVDIKQLDNMIANNELDTPYTWSWFNYISLNEFDQPRYGWYGFDLDAAMEQLHDDLDLPSPPPEYEVPQAGNATNADITRLGDALVKTFNGASVSPSYDGSMISVRTPSATFANISNINGNIAMEIYIRSTINIANILRKFIAAIDAIGVPVVLRRVSGDDNQTHVKSIGFESTDNNYLRYNPTVTSEAIVGDAPNDILLEGMDDLRVLVNPSRREFDIFMAECNNVGRASVDADDNIIIWDAFALTHNEMHTRVNIRGSENILSQLSLYAFPDTLAARVYEVADGDVHPELTKLARRNKNLTTIWGQEMTVIDMHGEP